MTEILTKVIDDIGADDVHALVNARVPEGEQFEFKSGLPIRKGRTESWDSRIDVSDSILCLILKPTAFHKALPHRFVCFYGVQHGRVGKQLPKSTRDSDSATTAWGTPSVMIDAATVRGRRLFFFMITSVLVSKSYALNATNCPLYYCG